MRRYVNITDIRGLRSWQHHPSARLYMYMCMTCDWTNGSWSGTRRRVALELGLTDQEYRTALKNLAQDGLIEHLPEVATGKLGTPTQKPTQEATRKVTQRATQVTVVVYKDLVGGTSPKGQPNMQPNMQPSNQPSNNTSKNNKTYGLTLARMRAPGLVQEVSDYIHGNQEDAVAAIRAFLDAMAKKQKAWADEGDFVAHLMDWSLKRWMGAESRLTAANKAQERAERHAQERHEPSATEAAEIEARRKLDYLKYCPRSERAQELVHAWYQQGSWDKEPLKSLTAELLSKDPGLSQYLA